MISAISSNELRGIVQAGLGITPSAKDLPFFGEPTFEGPRGMKMWEPRVGVDTLQRIRSTFDKEDLAAIANHRPGEPAPKSLVQKILNGIQNPAALAA